MNTHDNSSSTPYDDVFRTMMAKSGNLRIPFINEMFHLTDPLPPDTPIENIANEYYEEFKRYEQNKDTAREKVVQSITDLCQYVNDLYQDRKLTYEKYLLITDMLKKVTDHLTQKYEKVRKELDDIMGGKVLPFKGEEIYNEGKAEGKVNELIGLVYDGALTEEFAAARAEKRYGIKRDDFKKMLAGYTPDDQEHRCRDNH